MNLTPEHLDALADIVCSSFGTTYVEPSTLVMMGELMGAGYLTAESDYDGLLVRANEKAQNALLARGLIAREPQEAYCRFRRLTGKLGATAP